jgi:hypothetical protein
MEQFNYQKICSELLSDLNEREKKIISRRFGLGGGTKETLESIGNNFGICRERVRQIQNVSFKKIKKRTENYKQLFSYFSEHLKAFGGLRREDVLLKELGGTAENEVYFLLNLDESLQRINENNNFHALWMINKDSYNSLKKAVDSFSNKLKQEKKPLSLKGLDFSLDEKSLISYFQASKKILKNEEDLYGLSSWPEINPRGVRDKAYLVFKKNGKPLHFSEVANLIENGHLQTVHNELIKDDRFVLVGRGIYALSEWGYYPGQVKDVISKILEEAGEPLDREDILQEVLKQRLVKKNTVLLNLSNKKYFLKDSEGKYSIKEA